MLRRRAFAAVALAVAVASGSGCSGRGLFGDGSSISVGTINHGLLRHGRALAFQGEGYQQPALWQARGAHFATDEMVRAIQLSAARVRREYPGSTLAVGDLTRRGGGDQVLHRSHESGRDGDLIFYAVDEQGKPAPIAQSMPRYDAATLVAHPPLPTPGVTFGPFSPRRFDVRRNWALVRALLEQPAAEIQFLFCHDGLKRRMLDWARSVGEDPDLLDRANEIVHQPGDSNPHDDHLHLRVYCSVEDRPFGCVDRGPVRWWKKRYKFLGASTPATEADALAARLLAAPFPRLPHFLP